MEDNLGLTESFTTPIQDSPSSMPYQSVGNGMVTRQPGNTAAHCPTCSSASILKTPSYVYALGRIEPRFPRPAIEKEFMQVLGRAEMKGKTDREAFHAVLARRENRYLVRQLCWVFTIEGLDTYILKPNDLSDFDLLIESIRPAPSPIDIDVVIGLYGPIAPPEMCNALMLPTVTFDHIYSFDRESLIKSIPRPDKIPAKEFASSSAELFERIMQIADNAGATDEHRALNYSAVRYPAIYAKTSEAFAQNSALTALEARPSRLSGTRKIVDVVFSYTNRNTDVTDKFFLRVDVTEEFPFLITKLSPYYDR